MCENVRMDIATSELTTAIAKLRYDRAAADVTLLCEGKTILAHSLILNMRFVFLYKVYYSKGG